ncbi:hypothetical protein LY76DRAFT_117064 [Colletotrichum caudatum]|nr:hypothetical protein LY76DRAFT_117064 [Colletotrichum caudatum]
MVFKTNPNDALVFLVDVKSDPREAWLLLIKQLNAFNRSSFSHAMATIRYVP